MTDLRRYRLLLLAGHLRDHKGWYSQYCILIREGLCGWVIGSAYRTEAGEEWMRIYDEGPQ